MEDGKESMALGHRSSARREAEVARRRECDPRVDPATHALLLEFSHELRGRLNAINGWADVLESCVSDELAMRALETIKRNAAAQAKIIRDLLDRIERAAEPPDEAAAGSASDLPLRVASGVRSGR